MEERPLSPREYLLVPVAIAIGALLLYQAPFIGVPLSAAVLGRLVFAGAETLAVSTALLATAASIVGGVERPLMVGPTLLMLIWAARAISRQEAWRIFAILTTTVFVSFVAAYAVGAGLAGMSLPEAIGQEADFAIEQYEQVFVGEDAEPAIRLAFDDSEETIRSLAAGLWPGTTLVTAMLAAGLAVILLARIAIMHGILPIGPRPLVAFDLPLHVVWPLIAGLAITAWAIFADTGTTALAVVGFNLLFVSVSVVTVQGFGVTEFLMRRFRMRAVLRLLAYGLMLWVGGLIPPLAVVGAADLWVNFRKLPRGDEPPGTDAENAIGAGVE